LLESFFKSLYRFHVSKSLVIEKMYYDQNAAYGVMSYAVSQRSRELGLRMALGATTSDLLRLVMSRGLALTAVGIMLGAGVSVGLTRLMGDLLYQVSPRDPLAFGSAFFVMMIASLAACFLPAWRATRIDPVRALKD
jgi:putative ABC transport system permease protein